MTVLKSQQAVYSLLKLIPEADIQPLPGNSQCCGGAGAYAINQPEMAAALLDDKLNTIILSETVILASSNIGCSLHIANGLREKNLMVSVMHPIQIIAGQMGFTGKV